MKIDFKATITKNLLATIFLAVGIVLVVVGLTIAVPRISLNNQIVKQVKYTASTISKSIYICSGLIISCISALKLNIVKK